jgi:pre-mRNA-splicing helicase BRR2
MLAMLRVFKENPEGGDKIVFVAPFESICEGQLREWSRLFAKLGKKVAMLSGQSNADVAILEKNDIIISVPEYWDIMSRRWKQRKQFGKIALFIVSELHLLGENSSVLEVVTSRMRYISS